MESKSTMLQKKDEAAGLSRRELIKVVGTSAGLACLLPITGCENLWERQQAIPVDRWHKGVCRFCGTGCGVMIGVNENKVVDVKGDDEAHNRGRLCIKGLATRDILYTEGRALYPMIRKHGELQRASWDEAMALVAQRFTDAIETHGPDSVAFYGSGQLYTEESYTANKLFKAGIGTNNMDGNPRLCMASAVTGYTSTFGKDEPAGCYEDIDHAECFFVTGSNTLECHPIVWERVQDRKRSHPGTKIILVDPRSTFTAQHADLHLQIIPGTDVALYNAMIYVFLEQNLIDRDMIEHYLSFQEGENPRSFADFTRHIALYSPETAARTCGISSVDIREAAFLFASSKATMSLWTMGLNQQAQGTASNRLVSAMHLLTGHFGRPGATPFSLTGQPNACGGVRDTGSLSHALPNGRFVTSQKHREEMEDLWKVPRGRISPKPGHHAVALFDAMNRGAVKCCLIMCTNPGHTLPDITAYRQGMDRAFLVVSDAFHPTETTKFADVVLPAALWVEKDGVTGNAERRYHLSPKLVDPPGEARSDLDMLLDLADRLGHNKLLSARTPKDVWDEWRKISAYSQYNFEGITYERLQKERGLLWPCPTDTHPGTKRRYIPGEDPMATGSGRFDFYGKPDRRATVWLDHQEDPLDHYTADFPLIFNTGRILEHWHTMTITGRSPTLQAIHPDYLEIHPYDAHPLKIADGDPVVVKSRRGEVELRARLTDVVRPGMVFATMHSALYLVNLVTHDVHDPFSKQPAYKRCAVSVRRKANETTMTSRHRLFLLPFTAALINAGPIAVSAQAAGVQDIITSVEVFRTIGIVAALAGIVLLFLVQYVYRTRLLHGTYHRLLLIGVFLLPLAATWSTTATVMEGTKTVQACTSCHVMHPFVNDMASPTSPTLAARHYRNNWIAKDQCYACHVTYGVTGTLEGKRDGFRHWVHYVTNTYQDPIRYVGSYANSNCLSCHQNTGNWTRVTSHRALANEFSTDRIACISCHGPPHPLPKERASAPE